MVLMFRCKKCKGKKVVKEKKRVEFQIDPGTPDGENIALKGEADEAVSIALLNHEPSC
jgi:DnaJ family protein A protein 2